MLDIHEHVSLKPYTVFKIGGAARYFCAIQNIDELQEVVGWAKTRNLPFMVLGAGSNVLVSDEGYFGLVIRLLMRDMKKESENALVVEAGVSMASAAHFSISHGLGGMEWAIGIPGTIGGSVFGNAGCFGGEMKDIIESVDVFDTLCATNCQLLTTNCSFSYRNSVFKEHPELIIAGATLKLSPRDSMQSTALVHEYSKMRITTQDIGSQCAGCIFKNFTPSDGGAKIPAGKLIDDAGLKGTKIGGAMVSLKHGNFIINTGGATAKDVKQLVALIKDKVKSMHGIELEEEIRYIG